MTRDSYLTKVLSSCCNPTKAQQTANAKKYPQGYFKDIHRYSRTAKFCMCNMWQGKFSYGRTPYGMFGCRP